MPHDETSTARPDRVELEALLATLRRTAPEADTLCEGWQARHLVAHLYLRRHRPWQVVSEKPGSAFDRLAEEATEQTRFHALVEQFAAEPPAVSPMGLMDGPLGPVTNLVEYAVHHEDVRRGEGPVPARRLDPEVADALFDQTTRFARLALRSAPVGVVLVVPGGRRRVVRRGADAVAVVGAPLELALVAAGRRSAADVEVTGSPETVAAFEAAVG